MKILYLFLLLLLPVLTAYSQDAIDRTAGFIRTGDVERLSKTFAPTIELSIMDSEDSYTPAKATELLNDFFKQHPAKSIKILHRITSNANYRFAVLSLATVNGNFRVSFNLKNKSGHFELNDLHIEAQKQNSP